MSLKERYYGKLTIDPPLRDDDKDYLIRFNKTRHCKRDVVGFGTDGEFWVEEKVADGETYCEPTITDVNTPPGDQPNLTCPWVPSKDGRELVLDNRTEHEDGFLWLSYLMKKILSVRGYSLSGTMMRRDSSGIYKMTWKDGKPLHAKIEPSSEYEDSNFEDEFTKEVGPLVAQIVKRKREECDK